MTDKKEKRRFDKALLDECIKRDGATLIGEYEKLSGRVRINYKCKCGKEGTKLFERIISSPGVCCKDCLSKIRLETMKKKCLEKYGVVNAFQSDEIKEKIKKTNLEKYGTPVASQNKNVQEKMKKKCLEKYGTPVASQNKNVQEKMKKKCLEKYGTPVASQNKDIQEKIKKTNLEKYGVSHITQNNDIKEKIKKTNLEKYGTPVASQNKDIQEKIKKTNVEKYGVEYTLQSKEIRDKGLEKIKEKYGVSNISKNKEIKEKKKKTCLLNYGTEHPNQNPINLEKAQKKKWKDYKMPSGSIRKVQGYEPFALDTLVKNYTEEQIKTDRKDVPRVEYEADGKKKYYFPDIFIPHENKLIEVKSTWTYKCKTDNIQKKAEACKTQGYTYEIWCYNAKGNRVEI